MNAVKSLSKNGKLAVFALIAVIGLAACSPQPVVSSSQGYLDTISVSGIGEAISRWSINGYRNSRLTRARL